MKYSTLRLLSGAFLITGLIISESLTLRVCITIFLIILASWSGRKFRLLPNIILLVSISLAHTLSPNGLVLFSIGDFPITLGALSIGAQKGLLLISFIYASHYMMSSRPQIPGKLGNLLSLQFYYFDCLTTRWRLIEKKRPFIGALDQLLLGIDQKSDNEGFRQREERSVQKKDIIIHIMHILIMFLLLFMFSDVVKGIYPFMALLP
jgi:hypothetical protein